MEGLLDQGGYRTRNPCAGDVAPFRISSETIVPTFGRSSFPEVCCLSPHDDAVLGALEGIVGEKAFSAVLSGALLGDQIPVRLTR